MKTLLVKSLFFGSVCCVLLACGGGSSDSGMLIEGKLTEAGGASHSSLVVDKHSEGESIENVQICALGECSTTDGKGQWGFVASKTFNGGDLQFSIKGHGIDALSVVRIPEGAKDVFLDFRHVEGGAIEVGEMTVDGAAVDHESSGDEHDHDGHEHEEGK